MPVFDATPLIYLAKARKLEELAKLEEEKVIPEKVYREAVIGGKDRGEPDAERIEEMIEKGVLETRQVREKELDVENEFLSQADIEVLVLARQENAVAVIDEEYGRNIAEVESIKTRGTAYLVLSLLKKGALNEEEARETIDKMVEEGWHCSTDLYKDIISKIDELSG